MMVAREERDVGVLCAILRRTAGDAQDRLAGIDPELPGLLPTSDL